MSRKLLALAGGLVLLAPPLAADVHLSRRSDGSIVIFNDNIGSGWRVNGKAPSDAYLVARKNAATPYDEVIRDAAYRHNVDPQLVKSVMLVESNFNPMAVSRKGARGLMQLMPATARSYGVSNAHVALENIEGGVRHLSGLLSLYRGEIALAVAAYNAGASAVARYAGIPPYPETQEYVRRVLVAYGGQTPTLRTPLTGGFRGAAAGPVVAVPVSLADWNGTRLLSNDGTPQREAPLLGRLR